MDGDADVERGPSFRAAVVELRALQSHQGEDAAVREAQDARDPARDRDADRAAVASADARESAFGRGGVRGGRAGGPEPRVARGLEKRGGDLRDVEEGVAREEAEDGHEVLVREAVHRGGRAGERGGAGRGGAGGAAAGPRAAASAAPGAREDASWSRRRAE